MFRLNQRDKTGTPTSNNIHAVWELHVMASQLWGVLMGLVVHAATKHGTTDHDSWRAMRRNQSPPLDREMLHTTIQTAAKLGV